MQTLEQSASTIEENYNSLVSPASKFNNNFTYRYPGWSLAEIHAEIQAEFPGQCHVGRQAERPTVQHYYRCPRNQMSVPKPNNNFDHWHLGQSHAEISAEIPGPRHVESHFGRPMMSRNQRCPRSQREPNNNSRPQSYEHHFAFMATTVDSNLDLPGDDDAKKRTSSPESPWKPQRLTTNILAQRGSSKCTRRSGG